MLSLITDRDLRHLASLAQFRVSGPTLGARLTTLPVKAMVNWPKGLALQMAGYAEHLLLVARMRSTAHLANTRIAVLVSTATWSEQNVCVVSHITPELACAVSARSAHGLGNLLGGAFKLLH